MIVILALLGLVFVAVLVIVGLWFQASADLAETWAACYQEKAFVQQVEQVQTVEQLNGLLEGMVDCIDQRKGWLAGMVFDRDEAMEKIGKEFPASEAPRLVDELNRYRALEEEMRVEQGDLEAEYQMEQFRRQAGKGATSD